MQKCQECFQEYPEDALTLAGVVKEKESLIELRYLCPLCYSIKIRHPYVYNVQLPQFLIIKTRG
ncbi:MAG: hypothetical protein ACM3NT_04255 [Methylocystaceae bacterium]